MRRAHLRGEWVTEATILALFMPNFATGLLQAMAPGAAESTGFALAFGALLGPSSGSLPGRVISVVRAPVNA